MLTTVRAMPGGIRLFLVYALLILAAIGVALPRIIELAVNVPVSFEGLIAMILLAYTIFTTTLVLQRKEASRALALGLASLTIPAIPLLLLSGLVVQAVFVAAFAGLLFRGLLSNAARQWLSEP
jgi:succinate-acetate transporter protein